MYPRGCWGEVGVPRSSPHTPNASELGKIEVVLGEKRVLTQPIGPSALKAWTMLPQEADPATPKIEMQEHF
jgi:hypothetical protein